MKEHEKILKALANRRRLTLIKFLKEKKTANVTTLAEHLELSFKATSRHLAVLRGAGIVDREQKSLEMYYSISNSLPKLASQVIDLI